MPVTNIGVITEAIIGKIREGLVASGLPDSVFADPMDPERTGLSFYLYHARENARYKNAPPPGRDHPTIKLTSLGLDLYYQLTAHFVDINSGQAALEEQKLMTVALKTLHDSPLLSVGDDRFRVSLQPIPYNEAVHNWTAGSLGLKFSAYYEVSPVLIEPEKPTLYSGRVLLYGNFIFTSGVPRITGSSSTIEFILPEELTPRLITSQPGQAPPGGTINFTGIGFNDGTLELRIFNFRFEENVVAPGWAPNVSSNGVSVTVQNTAELERNGDPVDVLPGMYTAQVLMTKTLELPGGEIREFKQSSNQFPFIVTPVVDPTVGGLSGDILTVNGSGFQVMADPLTEKEEMEVYIGSHRILRSISLLTEDVGQFRVLSATVLELQLPAGMEIGFQPVRVLVAGAESLPVWKEII